MQRRIFQYCNSARVTVAGVVESSENKAIVQASRPAGDHAAGQLFAPVLLIPYPDTVFADTKSMRCLRTVTEVKRGIVFEPNHRPRSTGGQRKDVSVQTQVDLALYHERFTQCHIRSQINAAIRKVSRTIPRRIDLRRAMFLTIRRSADRMAVNAVRCKHGRLPPRYAAQNNSQHQQNG